MSLKVINKLACRMRRLVNEKWREKDFFKKSGFYLQDLKIVCNFAPVKNRNMWFLAGFSSVKSSFRKDGRVVDYTGLENRRAERHRGFESLSFRKALRLVEFSQPVFYFGSHQVHLNEN